MKLDASPETIRDTTEALKLAALLDDRVANADPLRIAAWAEQVARNRLTREDLLSGLQDFYDGPSQYPIGIGDLVSHARRHKRDRLEKDTEAEAEARHRRLADENGWGPAPVDWRFTAETLEKRIKNRTNRLAAAEEGLEVCQGPECRLAVIEYLAARAEAAGSRS